MWEAGKEAVSGAALGSCGVTGLGEVCDEARHWCVRAHVRGVGGQQNSHVLGDEGGP